MAPPSVRINGVYDCIWNERERSARLSFFVIVLFHANEASSRMSESFLKQNYFISILLVIAVQL